MSGSQDQKTGAREWQLRVWDGRPMNLGTEQTGSVYLPDCSRAKPG